MTFGLDRRGMLTAAGMPSVAATAVGGAMPDPVVPPNSSIRHHSYAQCHASTIVDLADGTIAVAWFGGSEEGGSTP